MFEYKKEENYIIIVDTDKYSGNFETEMFGYVTGIVSESIYDRGYAEKSIKDDYEDYKEYFDWWNNNVSEYLFDDEYGEQPVGIIPTTGYYNDRFGKIFKEDKNKKVIKRKYPSYQSVGIAVRSELPQNVLDTFKKRVYDFCSNHKDYITNESDVIEVIGYRMIKEEQRYSHDVKSVVI